MPYVNSYVSDEIYKYLLTLGKPSSIGAKWIKERCEQERKGDMK